MAVITLWNNPRPNKRLLVLDIDNTLAEFSETIIRRKVNIRKHLEEFLTAVYKYYDIVVWSSTTITRIHEKLKALHMLNNEGFKLLFALDSTHLAPAKTTLYGGVIQIKALSVIWEKFEQFDEKNTIIVDDQVLNFYFNPKNGLKITKYYKKNHYNDTELFTLTKYLKLLAKTSTNFSQEDLEHWQSYVS